MDEKRLVDGATALAEKQSRVIKIEPAERPQNVRLRVAAYTRVSSDSEDQLNSFAAQNRYYTELISGKAEWRMVDIYADEGISGTSVAKRDDFQRMMADCRRGLIDQILVKSISRFARNTKDCLQNIRELKELGVNVRFEREGIDTVNVSSELITAIYAAFAQKESESISGNMRWSYQRRMESGTFLPPSTPYGYRIINKKIEIDPERAVIICKIFQWYLNGISKEQIAYKLNKAGVLSNQNKAWRAGGIHYILTNERYIGDSLWQKTYTTEAIPAVRHRNTGAREQYYVEGTHPPIISKEVFTKVQILIQMRKENYGKSPSETIHPLSRKAICGCCGTVLRRKPQRGKYYWCCMRHDTNREECPLMPISETSLQESEAKLVQEIFHRYIAGESLNELTEALRQQDIPYDEGRLWNKNMVARILADTRYTGEKGYPKLIDEDQLIAANEKRSNKPQLPKKTEAQKVLRRLCGTPPSERVEQSVTGLLNGLANYPERIQHQRSPTPATHSKTQEALDNALEQQPIDEDNAKTLILRLAAEQYAALGNEEYETNRLRRLFSAFECVAELNADLLKSTVSEVLVTRQNVKLRLKNGQIIERSDLQ